MQENFQTLIIKKAFVWFEPVLLINTICWDGPFVRKEKIENAYERALAVGTGT